MAIALIPEIQKLLGLSHEPTLMRLAREGRRLAPNTGTPGGYSTNTPATVTAGNSNNIYSTPVPLGRAYVLTRISASADRACEVSWQAGPSTITGAYTADNVAGRHGFGSGGGQVQWTWNGGYLVPERTQINAWYKAPTTAGAFAWFGMEAIDITADFDFSARQVICVAGDSISWDIPSTNGTTDAKGQDLWSFRLTNRLREHGGSVRLINKGFGGATSVHAKIRIPEGYYDVDFDLLVVSLGMNDAAAGQTSQTDYKAALRAFITHRNRRRPTADVLLCGPSSTDDPNRTPYIASYRTWASEVAAEYGSGQGVYYVDLSTAYGTSSSDLSAYFAEPSGSHVHPNIAGHQKLYETIGPAVATTRFYQNRLGLTGSWT